MLGVLQNVILSKAASWDTLARTKYWIEYGIQIQIQILRHAVRTRKEQKKMNETK